MDEDKFNKMIEEAKKESKEDFLKFVNSVYGVDESIFDHIFEVPVIGRYDTDIIVTTPLKSKTEDELFEIVNEAINGDKKWENDDVAQYINFDEIEKLSETEKDEWYNIIKNNVAIVYNDILLKKSIDSDSKKLSEKKLYDKYKKIMKETITHERVHVNNAYCDVDLKNKNVELLNGAEANLRYDIDLEEIRRI